MATLVESESREQTSVHALAALEYAKIEAVKSRIVGLRMGIAASGIAGSVLASLLFVFGEANQAARSVFGGSANYGAPLAIAIIAGIPFIVICGYLSYRVNRHTDRLSRGKFEPRLVFEEE